MMAQLKSQPRPKKYLGTPSVAERYDRTVRTVQRWLVAPPAGFPKPVKHNGRWLWSLDDLDAYDAELARANVGVA